MATARISKLALFWFLLVTPVVLIDGVFVLTRAPASAADPTHPLAEVVPFKYWTIYAQYDYRYTPNDDAFVVVQSYLNLVEVALGVVVVVLELVAKAHGAAVKLALAVCMMTLYKTAIYYAMDVVEGGKYTEHNSTKDQALVVWLPLSLWILVPGYIMKQCFDALKLGEVKKAAPTHTATSPPPKRGKKAD